MRKPDSFVCCLAVSLLPLYGNNNPTFWLFQKHSWCYTN